MSSEGVNLRADGDLGDVLVVGGGISGIQAALDLATSGFKVFLVERAPTIGGKMAQLDKTFPTNDCSMCILAPKMIECAGHANVTLHTYSELVAVEGELQALCDGLDVGPVAGIATQAVKEFQRLAGGKVVVEVQFAGEVAGFDSHGDRFAPRVEAEDPEVAAVWPDEVEQAADRRCFPRTIRAEEPEDLAALDL